MNCKMCKNLGCAQREIDFQKERCDGFVPKTNADRIRTIDEDELAQLLATGCHKTRECPTMCEPIFGFDEVVESCKNCWLDWLRQEVES